jgi:myo-inositol-1(or 4)-monophosphatase
MIFSKEDLERYQKLAEQAALQAEPILLKYFHDLPTVEEKLQAGLVTKADRESEDLLRDFFALHTPDFDFIGEEDSYAKGREVQDLRTGVRPRWIVDPLDGTTNFVHGFPIFCISIGLEFQGRCWVGVVYAPVMKQMFSAAVGHGSWLNNKQIHVSRRATLDEALVATGFVTSHKEKLEKQLKVFNKVIRHVRGLRRPGAAAYDLAMVAAGTFDAFWEESLHPWDTCAGVVLVEEAGGQVTQLDQAPYDPFCETILATNQQLHPTLSKILSQT